MQDKCYIAHESSHSTQHTQMSRQFTSQVLTAKFGWIWLTKQLQNTSLQHAVSGSQISMPVTKVSKYPLLGMVCSSTVQHRDAYAHSRPC